MQNQVLAIMLSLLKNQNETVDYIKDADDLYLTLKEHQMLKPEYKQILRLFADFEGVYCKECIPVLSLVSPMISEVSLEELTLAGENTAVFFRDSTLQRKKSVFLALIASRDSFECAMEESFLDFKSTTDMLILNLDDYIENGVGIIISLSNIFVNG